MEVINLKSLYILNLNILPKNKKASEDEIQDAKTLYYYPDTEDIHIRRSNCGIIEGTMGFFNAFQISDDPFFIAELSNFLYIADIFDHEFYVIMLLQKPENGNFTYNLNSTIQKSVYKKLLRNFYENLLFFHGRLKFLFEISDNFNSDYRMTSRAGEIMHIINDFVENYFEGLSLNRLYVIDSILYFPLIDKEYMEILLSVQRMTEKIKEIEYSCIIYKGYLIHNDIPIDSMSVLYNVFFNNIDASSKYNDFKRPKLEMINSLQNNQFLSGCRESIDSLGVSPIRKCFELKKNSFLIGLNKLNMNNYQFFIPVVYLRKKNQYVKLLVYYYEGLFIFVFLNESFNPNHRFNRLLKLEKYILRYFENPLNFLNELYVKKQLKIDNYTYFYLNNSNRSIKISALFYSKKSKNFDFDKIENLLYMLSNVNLNNTSSLTNFKNFCGFCNGVLDRKIILFLQNGNKISYDKQIDQINYDLFEKIFIID